MLDFDINLNDGDNSPRGSVVSEEEKNPDKDKKNKKVKPEVQEP